MENEEMISPPTTVHKPLMAPPAAMRKPLLPPASDYRYTANGIRYTVAKREGQTFTVKEVPFAKFDSETGQCDRYVALTLYRERAEISDQLDTLIFDLASLLRHGKEWAARPMFGPNGFYYGKTPLEAARNAVVAARGTK